MEGSLAGRGESVAGAASPVIDRDRQRSWQEALGFGLKGRLQLAFGAITAFVVIATGVGLYAFFEVGKSLDRITQTALPPALTAGELSAKVEFIVAAGPALLASNNTDEIAKLSGSVQSELASATGLLERLRQAHLDKSVLDGISESLSALNTNLALLRQSTSERVGAETKRKALVDATFQANREFDRVWEPRFADLRGRVM